MLKRNDYIVAKMLQDKDIFLAGAVIKNVWADGKPTQDTVLEVTGFVILEGLDYQIFKFKYSNSEKNIKKLIELKTKGILKVKDMPGFNIDDLFNYKDLYFGQNLISMGDI